MHMWSKRFHRKQQASNKLSHRAKSSPRRGGGSTHNHRWSKEAKLATKHEVFGSKRLHTSAGGAGAPDAQFGPRGATGTYCRLVMVDRPVRGPASWLLVTSRILWIAGHTTRMACTWGEQCGCEGEVRVGGGGLGSYPLFGKRTRDPEERNWLGTCQACTM
jgi:hypothetical protein